MSRIGTRENILDPNRRIGAISAVFPSRAFVNLGDEAAKSGTSMYGHPLGTGQVGEFVLIDCNDVAVIGRISAVRLAERDRLVVNTSIDDKRSVDPIGELDLLATLELANGRVYPGGSESSLLFTTLLSRSHLNECSVDIAPSSAPPAEERATPLQS